MIQFPKEFLWGAATSAYQVEGGNVNSDWWEWERKAGKEPSGACCRHYELYKSDFDLAKQLNHNAHRLSVEWSRIEPAKGEISSKEIGHYQDVILSLRERNITPVVTLHHFTNPLWFTRLGGWENKEASGLFLRFAERIVNALCDKVQYWVTINEPLVYAYHSYILGAWPPQEKSFRKAGVVTDNLIRAHVKTYKLIHGIYKSRGLPRPYVSIAKNVQAFMPCKATLRNSFAAFLRDRMFNFSFVGKLLKHKSLDFIGLNYYTRALAEAKSFSARSLLLDNCSSQLKKNSLGWDIYPQGLYDLLLKFKRFGLPLFILENGISTDDDGLRWEFIDAHLRSVHSAMEQGVKVLGYIYWSLLDNFEWDKGFAHRFGLIEVDYNTYERRVRESGRKFAEVCRTGVLE